MQQQFPRVNTVLYETEIIWGALRFNRLAVKIVQGLGSRRQVVMQGVRWRQKQQD